MICTYQGAAQGSSCFEATGDSCEVSQLQDCNFDGSVWCKFIMHRVMSNFHNLYRLANDHLHKNVTFWLNHKQTLSILSRRGFSSLQIIHVTCYRLHVTWFYYRCRLLRELTLPQLHLTVRKFAGKQSLQAAYLVLLFYYSYCFSTLILLFHSHFAYLHLFCFFLSFSFPTLSLLFHSHFVNQKFILKASLHC